MKKIIMLLIILCTVSAFSETVIKGDLLEIKDSWRGIWRVKTLSFDGGSNLQSGNNKVLGIMEANQFKNPSFRIDAISVIRIIEIDGTEKTVIAFSTVTDKAWLITELSPGTLILVVKSLLNNKEMFRAIIKITPYIQKVD